MSSTSPDTYRDCPNCGFDNPPIRIPFDRHDYKCPECGTRYNQDAGDTQGTEAEK